MTSRAISLGTIPHLVISFHHLTIIQSIMSDLNGAQGQYLFLYLLYYSIIDLFTILFVISSFFAVIFFFQVLRLTIPNRLHHHRFINHLHFHRPLRHRGITHLSRRPHHRLCSKVKISNCICRFLTKVLSSVPFYLIFAVFWMFLKITFIFQPTLLLELPFELIISKTVVQLLEFIK